MQRETSSDEPPVVLDFDHIGLVVTDLAVGRRHLDALFAQVDWTREIVDTLHGVGVQFGIDRSGQCYELIVPLDTNSPVSNALKTGDRILNHLAYRVADLSQAQALMAAQSCLPIGAAKPAVAYAGCPIQFFFSPLRFLIELIEAPHPAHVYAKAAIG